MPLSFPSSPTVGQTSTQNGRTFTWSGYAWELSSNVAGHASTHGAGAADAVTIATSQITGLATVATSGSASDLSTGTLPDARLSSNVYTGSTLPAIFHSSTTALDLLDRRACSAAFSTGSGTVNFTYFTAMTSMTVSQISMVGGSIAASGLTLARMGLYTADAAGAVTLVARTASDTTLFNTINTVFARSFATAGGYPSTYSLVAGTRYAAALVCVGTTIGNVLGNGVQIAQMSLSPVLRAQLTGQSDLPTSVTSNGFSALAGGWIYYFRLS